MPVAIFFFRLEQFQTTQMADVIHVAKLVLQLFANLVSVGGNLLR